MTPETFTIVLLSIFSFVVTVVCLKLLFTVIRLHRQLWQSALRAKLLKDNLRAHRRMETELYDFVSVVIQLEGKWWRMSFFTPYNKRLYDTDYMQEFDDKITTFMSKNGLSVADLSNEDCQERLSNLGMFNLFAFPMDDNVLGAV